MQRVGSGKWKFVRFRKPFDSVDLDAIDKTRDTPSPWKSVVREPTEPIGALSARLPVQLFAQRSAYFSDPRLSASTRRWCTSVPSFVLARYASFRSRLPLPPPPPPPLSPGVSLSLSPSFAPFYPSHPVPSAVAFKVGAPRAPENFLIDPRTSRALYSTCDSSSPLLISSPLPPHRARELVIVPTTEPRYQRRLRFHRSPSSLATEPRQISATVEINATV